ncbi:hypothetical protein KIL84_005592 [Mauremys mutica]|uniref:Uncharacterized protein n=1 Tax=Mauremys mutica TaxID=74926 RepID=A0A9D3XGK7_9SAUR|nr:hypothetical protein KIL84_005592 [Mauremys mutica]
MGGRIKPQVGRSEGQAQEKEGRIAVESLMQGAERHLVSVDGKAVVKQERAKSPYTKPLCFSFESGFALWLAENNRRFDKRGCIVLLLTQAYTYSLVPILFPMLHPITHIATTPLYHMTSAPTTTTTTTANPPESQSAHTARIVVPIVTGIFIVGLIIALWFVHTQRRKRALQKYTPGPAGGEEADAEKNTVYAQVGSLPLPSSRTGTRKGRLETKEDEMKTIYATVQSPNQSPPQTDDEKLGKDGLESTEKGEKTIYVTVNQATQTKTIKSTDADDSAATSIPQRATEYDKII